MRIRALLILASLAVLVVPLAASAAPGTFKVTGGGQIIVGTSSEVHGPGDTVGFNAHSLDSDATTLPAKGQFQYVGRAGGPGPDGKFHGTVTCLTWVTGENSEGETYGFARFGGHQRGGNAAAGPFFTVDVLDNGEGAMSAADTIAVTLDSAEPCEAQDEESNPELMLGRGNVQFHNAPA